MARRMRCAGVQMKKAPICSRMTDQIVATAASRVRVWIEVREAV
jgi:hypothetical protein